MEEQIKEQLANTNYTGLNLPPNNNFKFKITILISIILVISGISGYFFLFKFDIVNQYASNIFPFINNNQEKQQSEIEKAIYNYFDIREGLAKELEMPGSLDGARSGGGAASVALAQNSLSQGELVARGIATFLEIGRDKDVSNARQITQDDITYLYIAKDNLRYIYSEADSVSRSEDWMDKDVKFFFDMLLKQYKDMDMLIDELIAYKKFYASELFALDMEKLEVLGDEEMKILLDGTKISNNFERKIYFESVALEYINSLKELSNELSKGNEELKKIKVSKDLSDHKILEDMLKIKIDMGKAAVDVFSRQIIDIKDAGSVAVQMHGTKEHIKLTELQIQSEQNLLLYKTESKAAKLFQEIIKNDNELKDKAQLFREKFNIVFFIEGNTPLEDLLNKFYRQEKGKLQKLMEEFENNIEKFKTIGESNLQFTVAAGQIHASVWLYSSISADKVSFALQAPSGRVITKDNIAKDNNIKFISSDNYQIFEIDYPEPGIWHTSAEAEVGTELRLKVLGL